jgi:hypothetical protein
MRPVELVLVPPIPPHRCFKCMCGPSELRDYFIDLGCDTEFEGAVYICNECMKDLALDPQFVLKKDYDEVVALREEDAEKYRNYENSFAIAEQALAKIGINLKEVIGAINGRADSATSGSEQASDEGQRLLVKSDFLSSTKLDFSPR